MFCNEVLLATLLRLLQVIFYETVIAVCLSAIILAQVVYSIYTEFNKLISFVNKKIIK